MARLIGVILILALLGSAAFVWRFLNQPVQVIHIEGALTVAERAQVSNLLADLAAEPLMSINLAEVRARIASLSWPRSVTLRREWPYSLRVQLEKEMLVAQWADGGFVTSGARIISSPETTAELPLFACSFASPARAMEVYRMLQEVAGREGFEITRLSENTLGEWQLDFRQGPQLMLGAEELPERMHRFLLAWRRQLAEREVEYVDARYGNGIAVRWAEPMVAGVTSDST